MIKNSRNFPKIINILKLPISRKLCLDSSKIKPVLKKINIQTKKEYLRKNCKLYF